MQTMKLFSVTLTFQCYFYFFYLVLWCKLTLSARMDFIRPSWSESSDNSSGVDSGTRLLMVSLLLWSNESGVTSTFRRLASMLAVGEGPDESLLVPKAAVA